MCFVEAGTFMMGATSEQEHEAYSDEKKATKEWIYRTSTWEKPLLPGNYGMRLWETINRNPKRRIFLSRIYHGLTA